MCHRHETDRSETTAAPVGERKTDAAEVSLGPNCDDFQQHGQVRPSALHALSPTNGVQKNTTHFTANLYTNNTGKIKVDMHTGY